MQIKINTNINHKLERLSLDTKAEEGGRALVGHYQQQIMERGKGCKSKTGIRGWSRQSKAQRRAIPGTGMIT